MKLKPSFFRYILIMGLLLTLGCSATKLSNSWVKDDYQYNSEGTLLIYARSQDMAIRERYENKMVEILKSDTNEVKAAHIAFPNVEEDEHMSEEEGRELVKTLKSQGYDRVFVMFLKDTKVNYITKESGNKSTEVQPKRSGFSFTDSYNVNSVEYISQGPNNRAPDEKTGLPNYDKFNTYVVEGVYYDLNQSYETQRTAAFEAQVDEPATADEIFKDITGIFSKSLKRITK